MVSRGWDGLAGAPQVIPRDEWQDPRAVSPRERFAELEVAELTIALATCHSSALSRIAARRTLASPEGDGSRRTVPCRWYHVQRTG